MDHNNNIKDVYSEEEYMGDNDDITDEPGVDLGPEVKGCFFFCMFYIFQRLMWVKVTKINPSILYFSKKPIV